MTFPILRHLALIAMGSSLLLGAVHAGELPATYPGSGTVEDPFLISSAEHLVLMGQTPDDWDKVFLQVADIDLDGVEPEGFDAIGTSLNRFTGSFDGDARTISNFNDPGRTGLFGRVGGTLRNITLVDPIVATTFDDVGALVAVTTGGAKIENCHVLGGQITGGDCVGGLGGDIHNAIDCSAQNVVVVGKDRVGGLFGLAFFVERSWTSGSVTGEDFVGGLVGYVAVFEFCFSKADVHATQGIAGGLIGHGNDGGNILHHCYARGAVRSARDYVGGLVGTVTEASFDRCFATGSVVADFEDQYGPISGGLGGYSDDWSNSGQSNFWDTETSGEPDAFGRFADNPNLATFTGLTTAEAQTAAPYLAAGWDFVGEDANGTEDFWRMFPGEPDYPHLWWEPVPDNPSGGTRLIEDGSVWSYWDQGTRPDGFTTADLDFHSWSTGNAQLGFGDGDETTEIDSGHITYYFAKVFQVDAIPKKIRVRLLRDDGAIVYLNGEEIVRSNTRHGPVDNETRARRATRGLGEDLFHNFVLPGDAMQIGENTIAVEVHQHSRHSSDISFDLSLKGRGVAEPDPDSDGDGLLDEWEIANFGNLDQDADGDHNLDDDDLSNIEEQAAGTNPNERDSDDDGLSDGLEVALHADPNDPEIPALSVFQKILPNESAGSGAGHDVAISGRMLALGSPSSYRSVGAVGVFVRTMGGAIDGLPANPSDLFGKIVVSEIMYSTGTGSSKDEFIEILNISGEAIDLSGSQFSDSIEYTFADGTVLAPSERIFLKHGTYASTLGDGGERVHLGDSVGNTIVELRYDDGGAWPIEADGRGRSLVLRNPYANPAGYDPGNWIASSVFLGTPGAPDPLAESAELPPHPRWVQVANLEGCDEDATRFGAQVAIRRNTLVIGAESRVLVYERDDDDLSNWSKVVELDTDTTDPATLPVLAMHRDTILTRAMSSDSGSPVILAFEKRDGSWVHADTIESPEPQPVDKFGSAIALHRNTAVAGSACDTFVFRRNTDTRQWSLVTKLEEHDDDEAAVSVAVHRNIAVVASEGIGENGNPTLGKVYHRSAGGSNRWGRVATLPAPGASTRLSREYAVAVRGGTIVVGAPLADTTSENGGLVYLFKRRLRGERPWALDRIVRPEDGLTTSSLGHSVALSGNQVIAGAPNLSSPDRFSNSSSYVFPVHQRHRFRDWLAHFFTPEGMDDPEVAALSADPDSDGLNNEIEFALGLDPTDAYEDEDSSPSIFPGIAGVAGHECLTFTFCVPEVMPDGIVYEVQVSEALTGWQTLARRAADGTWSGAAEVVEHIAEDGRACITVHDTVEINEAATRYLRLSVEIIE